MGLLDSSGQIVVAYVYDAWGRLLETSGDMQFTLGLDNPLRYRGYVYDRETGIPKKMPPRLRGGIPLALHLFAHRVACFRNL